MLTCGGGDRRFALEFQNSLDGLGRQWKYELSELDQGRPASVAVPALLTKKLLNGLDHSLISLVSLVRELIYFERLRKRDKESTRDRM